MSHLRCSTRIQAPLARVYGLAHDPRHWSSWYVGFSEEKVLDGSGLPASRFLVVGVPFPLTQRVTDDRLGGSEARWHARIEGETESVELTAACSLLLLAGEYDWSYQARDGETEVTVTLDFEVPHGFDDGGRLKVVEDAEAESLEMSLENLKRYCEGSDHT